MAENLLIDNESAFWNGIHFEAADIPETTEKAILCGMNHGLDFWLPKSRVCVIRKENGRYTVCAEEEVIRSSYQYAKKQAQKEDSYYA